MVESLLDDRRDFDADRPGVPFPRPGVRLPWPGVRLPLPGVTFVGVPGATEPDLFLFPSTRLSADY